MNVIKPLAVLCLLPGLMLVAVRVSAAPVATVTIESRPYQHQYRTYGEVEPRAVLTVRTGVTGMVQRVLVIPGMQVNAGQPLAMLGGPDYDTELTAAEARYRAAQSILKAVQQNYPQFSSAEALARANAMFATRHARLEQVQAAGTLRAPVAGTVQSVMVTAGSRLSPADAILRLIPKNGLWVRATIYGNAAGLRPGMLAVFRRDETAVPVRLRVQSIIPPLTVTGGVQVLCVARSTHPDWQDGEFGHVIIDAGAVTQLPVVPTAALVMDQGTWWVLVADADGLHRREVEIGPGRGDWTYIRHGVHTGERVVAVNAYLLFHADISRHYAPPD